MHPARVAVIVAAALVLSGCTLLEPEAGTLVVSGRVTGDGATHGGYTLHLTDEAGVLTIVKFDRRDWYVAGVEKAVRASRVEAAIVNAQDVGLLAEVSALSVRDPGELNDHRFDTMAARAESNGLPFDRVALDAEWDKRLAQTAPPDFDELPQAADGWHIPPVPEPEPASDSVN